MSRSFGFESSGLFNFSILLSLQRDLVLDMNFPHNLYNHFILMLFEDYIGTDSWLFFFFLEKTMSFNLALPTSAGVMQRTKTEHN